MPNLIVEFTKMHGAGNDFVVLDNRFYHFDADERAGLAQRLCARRTGIGADGLLALEAASDEAHAYRMRYHNADGSVGTMCANGARCLARYARHAGIAPDAEDGYAFESDAGLHRATVPADYTANVRLVLPPPRDYRASVETSGGQVIGVWAGTQHAVRFVDDLATADLATFGPAVRHATAFAPGGTNASLAEVVSGHPARIRARTFEKGVEAETLACGTGAVAIAYAALRDGRVGVPPIVVEMPGGALAVDLVEEGVTLDGPAVIVFRGTVEWG